MKTKKKPATRSQEPAEEAEFHPPGSAITDAQLDQEQEEFSPETEAIAKECKITLTEAELLVNNGVKTLELLAATSQEELKEIGLSLGARVAIRVAFQKAKPEAKATANEKFGTEPTRIPECLPKFNPDTATTRAKVFLQEFDTILSVHQVPDARAAAILAISIGGSGRAWAIRNLTKEMPWKEAKQLFLSHFSHPYELYQQRQELMTIAQGKEEPVRTYADRFCELMDCLGKPEDDLDCLFLFERGLKPFLQMSYASACHQMPPKDIAKAVQLAIVLEAASAPQPEQWKNQKNQKEAFKKKCEYCFKLGHLEEECRTKARETSSKKAEKQVAKPKFEGTCYLCKEKGHLSSNCPTRANRQIGSLRVSEPPPEEEVEDLDIPPTLLDAAGFMVQAVSLTDANKIEVPLQIEGEAIVAQIDTGAEVSCLAEDWVQQKGLPIEPATGDLIMADGSHVKRKGQTRVTLEYGTRKHSLMFEVCPLKSACLIGLDHFSKLRFKIQGLPEGERKPEPDISPGEKVMLHQCNITKPDQTWVIESLKGALSIPRKSCPKKAIARRPIPRK